MATEAVSEIFDIASALAATYSSGSTNSTSLTLAQQYRTIIVYVKTGAQVSSGAVKVYCDGSNEDTTSYINQTFNSSLTQSDEFYTLNAASTNYKLTFSGIGKYFSVRIVYASGTSLVISSVKIEGKS